MHWLAFARTFNNNHSTSNCDLGAQTHENRNNKRKAKNLYQIDSMHGIYIVYWNEIKTETICEHANCKTKR